MSSHCEIWRANQIVMLEFDRIAESEPVFTKLYYPIKSLQGSSAKVLIYSSENKKTLWAKYLNGRLDVNFDYI